MSPASPDRASERVTAPDADRILAAEYVLGTLDNDDRRRVRARCAAEPQFAALVRLWERRLAPLHELAVPVIPSPDIWRAIASDLRSAPPALRGASLPRGLSPSPDPPRRPAMPEGRPLRSAGTGEGAVSRVRRLFGLVPGRPQESGRQEPGRKESGRKAPGRVEPSHGAERPTRRRAFPPFDPAPATLSPDRAEPDGRTPGGAIRDVRAAGLLPQVTSQVSLQAPSQASRPASSGAEIMPAGARLPDSGSPLKLVPPLPRPRPAPEPLTPPPAFMFLEPDPPPEPEPVAEETPAPPGEGAPAGTEPAAPAPAAEETPCGTEPAEEGPQVAAPAAAGGPEETLAAEPVAAPPAPPSAAVAALPVVPDGGVEATGAPPPDAEPPAAPAQTSPAIAEVEVAPIAEAAVVTDPAPAETVPPVAPAPERAQAKTEGGADVLAAPTAPADAAEVEPPSLEAVPAETPSTETPSADPAAGDKGEEAPLPGWAAEVASGEVSALPDEPTAPARMIVRQGPWRGISLLLALFCLGLGGLAAYREWIWPGEGYWVAVIQAEPLPAVSVRIDPDSGALHVRSFAPAPPDGETYRLWLVSPAGGTRFIGAFSSGLSERLPELARLGRRGLAGAELVVTREPAARPDTSKGPGADVVYRGRLVPE